MKPRRYRTLSPAELFDLPERNAWRAAAAAHRLAPSTVGTAHAAAFSAAVELLVNDSSGRALDAFPESGRHRPAIYRRLAVEVGLGLTSFKATVNGHRWPRFEEIDDALDSKMLGSTLRGELDFYLGHLRPKAQAKGQNLDQTPHRAGGPAQSISMTPPALTKTTAQQEINSALRQVETAWQTARITLARSDKANLQVAPRIDWVALGRVLYAPRHPEAATAPAEASVMPLAAQVRALLRDGEVWTSAAIKSKLRGAVYRGRTPDSRVRADDAAVDRALSRLFREGEIVRVSTGKYRVALRPEGD